MDGLTVGVEEEYQLVDADTGALMPGIAQVLPTATAAVGDQVEAELHQSQIEIGTTVCRDLSELQDELRLLRGRVGAAAEAEGYRLVAAASHPFVRLEDQRITHAAAYEALAERYGHLADEHLVFGCHVHVSLDDPELAIHTMNRTRRWLAPLLALSASSPFWDGADTSYSSYRSQVFGRWPTAGAPATFESRADYEAMVEELRRIGAIDTPARLYWDIRPSAKYPTLEVRVADVCTSMDDAVLVAALARGLVATCADQVLAGEPEDRVRPERLRAATWRAARHGLDAELVHPVDDRLAPADEVLHAMVAAVRPGLEAHGDHATVVELVDQVLARGTSARRQREVLAREGDMASVVRWLADATTAG